jgi:hypothetical protein
MNVPLALMLVRMALLAREMNVPLALMLVRMALRPISKTRSL